MHNGNLAASLAAEIQAAGGVVTEADLASVQPQVRLSGLQVLRRRQRRCRLQGRSRHGSTAPSCQWELRISCTLTDGAGQMLLRGTQRSQRQTHGLSQQLVHPESR